MVGARKGWGCLPGPPTSFGWPGTANVVPATILSSNNPRSRMANHPDESLAQTALCQDDSVSGTNAGRRLMVSTVDYHTAGEPFRIVSGGVPALQGTTILEKRRFALEHLDHIRQLLVYEPRGHADMYGGFVTEAENDGAQLGVVFFHNA